VYLYRNAFQYFRVGYAAALSWALFLIIVALTVILFRLQRRWVYYETEAR
jgi:multiple sugar transport system permease protein